MSLESNAFESEEEYEEGDEWIFSYADLMSLMVGFFVIMFLFAGPEEDKNQLLAEEIADSFKKDMKDALPIDVMERRSRAFESMLEMIGVPEAEYDTAGRQIRQIHKKLKKTDDASRALQKSFSKYQNFVRVFRDKNSPLRIVIPSQNIFGNDDYSKVGDIAKSKLMDIGREIARINRYELVIIEAHASLLKSSEESVFEATAIKASRVAEIILDAGVPRDSIRVAGMGNMKDSSLIPGGTRDSSFQSGWIEILIY